jgi:hypothetical protein
MEEESLARARAAKLSEVTWGQMEDAEEEEEQVRPPQPSILARNLRDLSVLSESEGLSFLRWFSATTRVGLCRQYRTCSA